MSFDPSSLTVKKAIAKLDSLSDEELSAVYDAELDGKCRKSLLDAITSARDDIREVASMLAEPAEIKAPVAAEVEAPVEAEVEWLDLDTFMRTVRGNERKRWVSVSANRFEKRG